MNTHQTSVRTGNRFALGPLGGDRNKRIGALFVFVVVATTVWAGSVMAAISDRLPAVSAAASADDGNQPMNTLDGSLATRWSASGDGQWLRIDLDSPTNIGTVKIAWYKGDLRIARFDIQTSETGTNWTTVFSGQSSGSTASLESYDVTDSAGQQVRIVGHGTSIDLWNSISEVELYATSAAVNPGGSDEPRLNISRASDHPNGLRIDLNWNGPPGTTYQVQASSNLVTWQDVGAAFTNNGSPQIWQENIPDSSAPAWPLKLYRLKKKTASPPATNTLPRIEKTLAQLQIGSKSVVHYRNRPLDVHDPRVTRAIIVVHGSGANASGYFDRINNVIPSSWSDKVMVIAPHFQEQTEAGSGEYWWDGDWREGGASGGISSYDVVDRFVELLRSGTFPNLKWIVIGGHSAGGQFTQRYAAFTDIDLKATPNSQYVKFVPANPSSYVYLNEYRPGPNNTWIIPQDCSSGDPYDEWKYGLQGLYGYTASRGADFARTHLPRCWVELLAGTFDNVVDDGLDLDCAAMRQGERRYDRAINFNAFLDHYYPDNNFSITMVPEVGHDSELIFASPEGRNAYFFAD